jgi:hypothetical protein
MYTYQGEKLSQGFNGLLHVQKYIADTIGTLWHLPIIIQYSIMPLVRYIHAKNATKSNALFHGNRS